MDVLVGYASAHGATRGIAERIAARLHDRGLQTVVRPLEEVGTGTVSVYDAAVLGSAIHNRTWLPEAVDFLHRNEGTLKGRAVWLFSVSSVGDEGSFFSPQVAAVMRTMKKEPAVLARFHQAVAAHDHHDFAGAIERSHWSRAGHLFLRALGGRYGDHRDWAAIDAGAGTIAVQLHSTLR